MTSSFVLALLACLAAPGVAQTTERISVDSTGLQGDRSSFNAAISADGRFVAFTSEATNLVPGDTNDFPDVFVHDRLTGQTTRVSVDSAGVGGSFHSEHPSISADGRFVAFESSSANLVPGDTNGDLDVFVHDCQTGQTSRVSMDSAGVQGNSYSWHSSISADGRFVAFESDADNLVPGDINAQYDVFVHDRQTGQTTRVSVDSKGVQGSGTSQYPSISADGRFIEFDSRANNLVSGDTNRYGDVFVHDRGGSPRLAVRYLVAGGAATIQVTSATAGGMVRHGYSLAGGGPIHTSYGLLLLSPPLRELPPMTANASGIATVAAPVPPGTTGIPVWVHAFDVGSLTFSNGVATAIG